MRFAFARSFAFVSLAMLAFSAPADQKQISDYATARERVFYRLYVKVPQSEATDIYCGIRFRVDPAVADLGENEKTGRPAPWLTLEHAYPADWMADALKCGNRTTCRVAKNATAKTRFNHAEADLHNLWPALDRLNSSRGKRPFGDVGDPDKTEAREVQVGNKTFSCNFENEGGIVEPRRIARGNLARSIFYMCREYKFPVERDMLKILKRWNIEDPPTGGERRRNDKIERVQGNRNPFIDKPTTASSLKCRTP